ncbi:MAG: ECF transporter S component [Ruminococcaceae bacterium]|nr:ECF transporter S component [Oscillospiraceae bacterium]
MQSGKKIKRITISGVLIALAFVLSFVKVYELPYGGSITLFSMVPIVLIGCMYGPGWGVISGLVYSVLQAISGAFVSQAFAGLNTSGTIAMCILDYIVAFAVLGLGGMFYGKMKNKTLAAGFGAAVAVFLRFLAHFASGWILWGDYAEWWFGELNNKLGETVLSTFSGQALSCVYSFLYNGSYMLPELILTVGGCIALMAIPAVRKQITANGKIDD